MPRRRLSAPHATLLVHALAIEDAERRWGKAPRFGRDVCSFIESTLLNPIRRAAVPFTASTYDKMQFLSGLHAILEEHIQPLEPALLSWVSGLPTPRPT